MVYTHKFTLATIISIPGLRLANRHCFHMARNVSVRRVLYFGGSMPMNTMLHERKIKLIKNCLNSSEVVSLSARIRSADNSFLDIFIKRVVYNSDRVSHNFSSYLYYTLKENGKL